MTDDTPNPENADPGSRARIDAPDLDLTAGPVALTRQLVDVYSESHHEAQLADALHRALQRAREQLLAANLPAFDLHRSGNTIVARTQRGLGDRVVLAGHIDTVPPADNLPSRVAADPHSEPPGQQTIYGLGSVDMKSGDACYIHAFVSLAGSPRLTRDLTLVLYEGEEVATTYNGLNHLVQSSPELLEGSLALLGEPSAGLIEAGCQGTVRVRVTAHGQRAHSARSWLGDNAMHRLARVLVRVADYAPRSVEIDGLTYREGLNVVTTECGVATNTIPDEAWAFINFRFAPNRSVEQALQHTWEVLAVGTPDAPAEGFSLHIDDAAPGALPGLHQPAAARLVAATGGKVGPKFGWTDVARFSGLGIPAVNFGPGDPSLCHTREERCPVSQIEEVSAQLVEFLTT
ncbi:succinyl-diaminopimelate desuccinylase [Corynebacterium heidelbergense]|uniref:Succinyl-diaminopimelate desuccinylase n=1 Tax=Corynebacterium heidelbergense TaxID=2055947 RepID=A0A364V6B2_9CORY|nr:succinyl-diaminopimelate desuccinylase [Corynebacterium heidelbergense]RAV32177.1 succinyl-diaminopimelate desuccinylase [Corynebacterium heidelbergense]